VELARIMLAASVSVSVSADFSIGVSHRRHILPIVRGQSRPFLSDALFRKGFIAIFPC
jgi:hypothetical protein